MSKEILSPDEKRRREHDDVKIGDIRKVMDETLERQIGELAVLIRKGYHHRHEAEEFLSEAIGRTLTQLDNLRSFGGLSKLIQNLKP